jgi:hypothetical protein
LWSHNGYPSSCAQQQVYFALGDPSPTHYQAGYVAQFEKDWKGVHESEFITGQWSLCVPHWLGAISRWQYKQIPHQRRHLLGHCCPF